MEPRRPSCRGNRCLVGDPIDVVTGANTDITWDFELPGPIPFRWRRYYSSAQNTILRPLGWGHSHEFDRTLFKDLDGLSYIGPSGDPIGFPPLKEGEADARSGYLLRRVEENHYEIAQTSEPVVEFYFAPEQESAPFRRLRMGEHTIEFRHKAGHLQEIIDSKGRRIRVESDREGRLQALFLTDPEMDNREHPLMTFKYDQAGNLVEIQDFYKYKLGFRYDQNRRMTCRTDRRGYSFHFEHDVEGRCIHSRGDDGLLEVFLEYHPEVGMSTMRRADGGVWTYFYNENLTITQITDPYGGETCFTLDDQGRPVEEIDPNGNVTKLLYNAFGQHCRRVNSLGYSFPPLEDDPYPDDPLAYTLPETPLEWEHGHLLDASQIKDLWPDDRVLRPFPPAVYDTFLGLTTAYDEGAARAASSQPAGETEPDRFTGPGVHIRSEAPEVAERKRYDPCGNLTEHRDRDGSAYRYAYTSWSLLEKEIDPLGNITTYRYSPYAWTTHVTDPRHTETEYVYDRKDRLTEVHRHGRLREQYIYDKATNIIEKKDGQGRTLVTWEIGPGNLDTVRCLASGEKHTFEYDERGRITKAVTPTGTMTCAYDRYGHLVMDQRDGLGVVHEFVRSQLTATTYFKKFRVTYGTDDNGDLVITDPTGAVHRVKISPAGGLIARLFANGTRELCRYAANGSCLHKAVVPSSSEILPWIRSYRYSAEGDLLAATDTQRGTTRYRYDANHRLIEEALPDGTQRPFEYDAAGNLVRQPGLTGVEMNTGNRLRFANDNAFTYNDRNHISTLQGTSGTIGYEYNDLDMLIRCGIDGRVWSASYDAYCRRVCKTWQGLTTQYYWDDFRLAAELRHDGRVRLYVYVDETALVPLMFVEYDAVGAAPESGHRYYVFTNQIGVPTRIEDDDSHVVWFARIDPYGQVHVSPASTMEMPLRFPGHYHDSETGLHDNRFRTYSPELGRYLQSDPLGIDGGINLYSYSESPLVEVDLDGLKRNKGKKGKNRKKDKKKKKEKKAKKKEESGEKEDDCESEKKEGGPYDHLEDPPDVAAGRDFSKTQKEKIIEANRERNKGEVKSDVQDDMHKGPLKKPEKSQKGVTPPQDEWQIDHVVPRDKDGTNSYTNAQVTSREYNRQKSNK
jgi:RHS repeat-associated protein